MGSAGPAAGRGASTATAPAASGWRSGIAATASLGSGNPVALHRLVSQANPLRALGSTSLSQGGVSVAGPRLRHRSYGCPIRHALLRVTGLGGHARLLYARARSRGGHLRRRLHRFGSGQAQVAFASGVEPALPHMGLDVDSREAVDAAHAAAVRAGHEVIYGPVDEPWGVRRFFVRDPQGVVISVLAHG